MSDEGSVSREVVIAVLRRHEVSVAEQADGKDGMMVLAKGERLVAQRIPDPTERKFIHYLSRTFNIPIHHFFNPDMIQEDGKA